MFINYISIMVKLFKMWKEAPEGQCYLADGSGFKITGEDYKVTLKGQVTSVPWTLTTYMDASGLKWPSRVRLYCVNMSACDGNSSNCYCSQT